MIKSPPPSGAPGPFTPPAARIAIRAGLHPARHDGLPLNQTPQTVFSLDRRETVLVVCSRASNTHWRSCVWMEKFVGDIVVARPAWSIGGGVT